MNAKQIAAFIGIFAVLIFCSISDFDLTPRSEADWDSSQDQRHFDNYTIRMNIDGAPLAGCVEVEIPQTYVDEPTDTNCRLATEYMHLVMNNSNTDCVWITNDGWFPATKNPMIRSHIEALLRSDAPY